MDSSEGRGYIRHRSVVASGFPQTRTPNLETDHMVRKYLAISVAAAALLVGTSPNLMAFG